MSTAGMGDVLTEIIAGDLAKGIPPVKTALFSVYFHGYCGDLASKYVSQESLIAFDILDFIPEAFMEIPSFLAD